MRIKIRTALLALSLFAASCSDVADGGEQPAKRTINVSVGSGPGIDIETQSRTALDPDGVSVKWVPGDKIALWAIDGNNNATLAAHPFVLWHYNEQYNAAKFTADIPVMAEGEYTYCALSPMPATIDGTRASYDIPAVQEGLFNGAYDVMVAAPVQGGALTEGDNSDVVNLQFAHKVHILKITVPANNLGEEVSQLEIDFPKPVTGRLTIDALDPDADPELANASSRLTLRFAQPLAVGATVYATIAPVDIPSDEVVTITAIGQTCESKAGIIAGKNFAAGHTTPITLNIPTVGRWYTRLTFSLNGDGMATLGEKVTNVTLTAPTGSLFDNGSNVRSFTPDADGKCTLILKPTWEDNLSGKTITVAYESENAVVSNTTTMPQITEYAENNVAAFKVPYLMEEDFSTVGTFSDNESKQGISDPNAIWIPGISGWSAARTGGSAGKSVRIVGHREGAWGVGADYEARMDSAPLSCIKAGKTVPVKISFNYSGSTNKGAPKFRYGVSNAQGAINGANSDIETQAGDISANTTGSYDNINQAITPFNATATNATRLAWVAYGSDKTSGFVTVYFWYYIYLDNIKVSIAQ